MPDDTPFFIVGSGRCGTTLLRLILCSHSRIHIPVETNFIEDLVRELPLTRQLTPDEAGRAVAIISNHRRWSYMEIPAEEFRRWAAELEAPTVADIINLIYRHQLKSVGKQRFGDKTPYYIRIIPQLAALYPGAKFIHLIRDGRDVAISFIDANFSRYYERDGFLWTEAMRLRQKYLNSRYAAQILEVRYEDLVAGLETTVRRVCEFIGEAFEPGMLDWHGQLQHLPEDWLHAHRKLFQPLQTDAIAAWTTKLSGLECFAIEACLHADLRRLGYPLRFSAAAWRPLLAVSGWALFAAAPLLRRGVPALQRRNYLPKSIYI
jgi:Sulfotransferase family